MSEIADTTLANGELHQPIVSDEPLFDSEGKLTRFVVGHEKLSVRFVGNQKIAEGVEAELYVFPGDSEKDLALVRLEPGHKTPLQRVLQEGSKTIEGFLSGSGVLTVTSKDGTIAKYEFKSEEKSTHDTEVIVEVAQLMQWEAGEEGLSFYEICWPPYQEGRYVSLPD